MTDAHPPETGPRAVRLLADIPSDLERDDFTHRSYSAVLASTLMSASQPLTIGLFGPWGVGKSSVLRRLKEDVCGPDCAFVVFDAWRYDGTTMRRQLLRDSANQLAAQDGFGGRSEEVLRRLLALDVDRQVTAIRTRPSLAGAGVALLQAVIVGAGFFGLLQLHAIQRLGLASNPKDGALFAALVGLVTLIATLVGQVFRQVPYVETHKRLEDPEQFHALFRDMIAAVVAKRLIIAVDNLDRCSPDDALDLLATIKTYLEPAAEEATKIDQKAGATEVLFVLAVDDQALRDHIAAEALSGGRTRGDADELLRKIFTASLRFAPLLADDMRGFIRQRLVDIRPNLGLADDEEEQLASLIGVAFGSTPRQVIQYVNVLQLRLALARQREQGSDAVIREQLSANPMMVAKLELIAERWPAYYQQLLRYPRLLEWWHQRAREPDDESAKPADWDDFAAFLRVSDGILVEHLRPYLQLKQARAELALPGYDEFRRAIVSGDRAGVGRILDTDPEAVESYADHVAGLFASELEANAPTAARSILDVALAEGRFRRINGLVKGLLRRALDDPVLGRQLEALPAEPLLEAARSLAPQHRDRVLDQVIADLGDESAGRSHEAARALAEHIGDLDGSQVAKISLQLGDAALHGRYVDLDVLSAADPSLLTSESVDALITHVESDWREVLLGPLAGPACRVLGRAISTDASIEPLVGALTAAVEAGIPDEAVEAVVDLAEKLRHAGHDTDPIAEALTRDLGKGADRRRHLIDYLWRRAVELRRDASLSDLVERLFADDPVAAAEFVRSHARDMSAPARTTLLNLLVKAVEAGEGLPPHEALRLVLHIGGNKDADAQHLLTSWFERAPHSDQGTRAMTEAIRAEGSIPGGAAGLLKRRSITIALGAKSDEAMTWLELATVFEDVDDETRSGVTKVLSAKFRNGVDVPAYARAVGIAERIDGDAVHDTLDLVTPRVRPATRNGEPRTVAGNPDSPTFPIEAFPQIFEALNEAPDPLSELRGMLLVRLCTQGWLRGKETKWEEALVSVAARRPESDTSVPYFGEHVAATAPSGAGAAFAVVRRTPGGETAERADVLLALALAAWLHEPLRRERWQQEMTSLLGSATDAGRAAFAYRALHFHSEKPGAPGSETLLRFAREAGGDSRGLIEYLMRLRSSSSAEHRRAAETVLADTSWDPVRAAIDARHAYLVSVLGAFARSGGRSVETLASALGIGEDAAEELMQSLAGLQYVERVRPESPVPAYREPPPSRAWWAITAKGRAALPDGA